MTYARDPIDTEQPPCFCAPASTDPAGATMEFCPEHGGDPGKPAPEPPGTCPECDNTGIVCFDVDTPGTPHYCGGCSGYPGIAHEPACGTEPCPEGCPVVPRMIPAPAEQRGTRP